MSLPNNTIPLLPLPGPNFIFHIMACGEICEFTNVRCVKELTAWRPNQNKMTDS